ncbi:MAG: 2-amino-4-hydroxy-6-hydroxymethyldihydropteridine diphosphokinase [Bacteroidota bacterium]|jgi:2-amino-4-hydroxy-6-hydroxymethyldihydropteridine diphosphokinase|nr:2-amino-4-hydroxy-6-hydroxymethyldihydropteridine diphosphokinase [Bacteroidota bacterium]
MALAYLLLGSNMGQSKSLLSIAADHIQQKAGPILLKSAIYESEAWGKEDQDPFLNQVLLIESSLSASHLLHSLLQIELQMGRTRSIKWGARIIDIDILFYEEQQIQLDALTIPHPAIADRRFTLVPLHEIAPDFIHPVHHKSIKTLLLECQDPLMVKLLDD